ncbi:MAG: DUF2017 family protein [bacterium]|nr:DUF2017 family protein [bacterium]MXZ84133.1 DUF2017 family protein [Acidimicrobiia bacterium]MDE0613873.1 DUF2017 family protein [bacterium]MYG71668.1 DUF2017 family protein [Acidimicrobiia bacterium]MYH96601.1 DUF2017 family protein [Acidimicrobiia bacterium]
MAPRRPIEPNGDGTYRLDLRDEERALIAAIVPDLRGLLADDPADEVLTRLFPTARPDDPEAEAEFQGMVRDELVTKRLSRLDIVAELAEATVLDQEQLAAWMGAVNDIRLVLGTRLGVTEDDEFDEADDDDPESVARSAYWYLGWLLEHLVEASTSEL